MSAALKGDIISIVQGSSQHKRLWTDIPEQKPPSVFAHNTCRNVKDWVELSPNG